MASSNKDSYTFILRFWHEPRILKDAEPIWRGVIEQVPTGQRRYVKDLDEIVLFIILYMREMGVVFSWRWRLWVWWHTRHLDSQGKQVSEQ